MVKIVRKGGHKVLTGGKNAFQVRCLWYLQIDNKNILTVFLSKHCYAIQLKALSMTTAKITGGSFGICPKPWAQDRQPWRSIAYATDCNGPQKKKENVFSGLELVPFSFLLLVGLQLYCKKSKLISSNISPCLACCGHPWAALPQTASGQLQRDKARRWSA